MDKSPLPIVALVVGILALLMGVIAYVGGKGRAEEALNAAMAAEDAVVSDKEIEKKIREIVDAELRRVEDRLGQVTEAFETRIKGLEAQAKRVDILAEAKRYAMKNAEESSDQLFTQVRKLREEIKTGDGKASTEVTQLRADVDAELKKTREMLKRLVIRWMEGGAM